MGTRKAQDLTDLYNFGRLYVQTGNVEELKEAALYWEIADTTSERRTVRNGFEEGVRNYADGMWEFTKVMAEFDKLTIYGDGA